MPAAGATHAFRRRFVLGHCLAHKDRGLFPRTHAYFVTSQQTTVYERTTLVTNAPSSLRIALVAGDQFATNFGMQSKEERIRITRGDCHQGTYDLLLFCLWSN